MPNPAPSSAKKGPTAAGIDKVRLEDLIQVLVDRYTKSNRSSAPLPEEHWTEEVILDVDVGGARYLLVRLPKSSRVRVQLSPREHEIVRMVAQGYPNKIIAGVLNISSWTVCTHLRRIFAKLGVGSRAAMVARVPDLCRGSEQTYRAKNLLPPPNRGPSTQTRTPVSGSASTSGRTKINQNNHLAHN